MSRGVQICLRHTVFQQLKKCPSIQCPPYSNTFYLIPTQLKTENSVRLKTAIRKKCPLYYCSELKSVRLIPTLLSPPYSNIFLYSKSVYLIPELCPPQYRRQVSVLFLHSVHFIPTWCLPYSYLVFVYLILTSVCLNVGTL